MRRIAAKLLDMVALGALALMLLTMAFGQNDVVVNSSGYVLSIGP